MAAPRVFISSTCYDLKYIRENIKYFIRQLGYDPILSEDGSVFFDPKFHTHDACIAEVPNCQIFILIIGGRHGGNYKDSNMSITNAEFKKAIELKIPVFALVEQSVYSEHLVYLKNKKNTDIDESKIIYPAVDNIKIFDFIDEVRTLIVNNALVPFKDFGDIELYLRQQWAGMMYSFLRQENERERISSTIEILSSVNERIEMLSRQILASVGNDYAKITAELYDEIFSYECIRDLKFIKLNPTPHDIITAQDYLSLSRSLGNEFRLKFDQGEDGEFEDNSYSLWGDGGIGEKRLQSNATAFMKLKESLKSIFTQNNMSIEEYLEKSKRR